ncbi:hypothetical protein SLEP1_g22710 [Rubroshorea leprosula]|uniref:Uncharacterized protein n=1 Tax=Rubroshorea leprosula TaxID=152421 RepID=A0AAV5JHB8_9ROSI|nr:hypothetical protein SLEP1_g22710 [Rubroshorea leprosula]
MTYKGDVYFVFVLVSVFRDYTCWHALSLIRGTPYLLTEIFYLIVFLYQPFQEAKPRTEKPREVTS